MFAICATCAVEYTTPPPEVCPVCADEREWSVPDDGQQWTSLPALRADGQRLTWSEAEPNRVEIGTEPSLGIGQTAQLVTTPAGSLLWDPTGYLDDVTVERILARGPVLAVAASHPHMFGVQVAWGESLDAPVLVCAADEQWVGRRSDRIELYGEWRQLGPGLSLHRVGGHFPGSAIAHWADGAGGRGVVLSGDTVYPNPDRRSVGFLRSYPNRLPLSGAAVRHIADRLASFEFDRIVGNFANPIETGARDAVEWSAQRHIAWVRGDHDGETGTVPREATGPAES
ncbi:hypothetical protein SAMN05216184_101341 [Georgenia satyanarayanai]|uniref:Hydrolase n=1 Tax=Georgenia satyanarayanai TaxID=860221 RepID=A0A2Y9A2F6_9MICO|nr:hydrolase [Georgenia satyanarayanai]PYG01876.1 hypothetical protein A8987_101341 [Georgenia satyanarayanai]SSA36679.1 hypothetical protein SAMN05216184_101341 [Georgenia satyanarayanai]